jgi:1,4-alpha-glucan branching enzyme
VATISVATTSVPTTSTACSPFLTDFDLYLWGEGKHYRAYEKLGAHLTEQDELAGTHFAVWAPNAREVSVIGDFNGWEPGAFYLHQRGTSGIWEGFVPGVGQGALYKFATASSRPTPMPSPPRCAPTPPRASGTSAAMPGATPTG